MAHCLKLLRHPSGEVSTFTLPALPKPNAPVHGPPQPKPTPKDDNEKLLFELNDLLTGLSFQGKLIFPWDAEFANATSVFSWVNQEKPSFVIWCAATNDVALAIQFLTRNQFDFTVACGRHTLHCQRGNSVQLSLGGMRGVTVDPERRVALVQGGARNGDFDQECRVFGLGTPVGTNQDTGVGGLVLGGGIGYLSRRYGLTLDNLVSLTFVTAKGEVKHITPADSEIWWGYSGAGYNFGVVTQFQVKLHPVGEQNPSHPLYRHVINGAIIHPFPNAKTVVTETVQRIDAMGDKERDLSVFIVFAHGPTGHPAVIVAPSYTGESIDHGFALVKNYQNLSVQPVMDATHPSTYWELQQALEHVQRPGYWFEKSVVLSKITPEIIDLLIERYAAVPKGCERTHIPIVCITGAIGDRPLDSTAFRYRGGGFWVPLLACCDDPAAAPAAKQWLVDTYARIIARPEYVGAYANSADSEDVNQLYAEKVRERLRQLKQKWDPNNIFHHNHNIKV